MPCSFYPANLLASATLPPRADLQSANNSTVTFRSLANAAGFTNPRFQILVGGCPPIGASNNCYFFGDSPLKRFATTLPATYYGALHQPKGVGTHPASSPHGRDACSERYRYFLARNRGLRHYRRLPLRSFSFARRIDRLAL